MVKIFKKYIYLNFFFLTKSRLFLGILSLDSQHQKIKDEVEDGMRLSKDLKNLTNLWKVLRMQESTSLQYILKIKFLKILEKYPRLKNSFLSLNFSKD